MRTLSLIRTDFIEFLQQAFSDGKVKANGQTIFRWDQDEKKSKIIIKGTKVSNPEVLNNSPAILVSRGDVSPDPNTKGLKGSLIAHDWETGDSQYGYLLGGPIFFNCIAPNEEESEILATIVFTLIGKNMTYLRGKYKYRAIVLGGIGKPRILKYEGEGTNVEAWNCGIVAEVKFHFGYVHRQGTGGAIGEMEFPSLNPVMSWIDQEE